MTTPTNTHARRAVSAQARTDRVATAGRRLYDAEVALHHAHQSHVDEWISAAADRLHEAIVDYELAIGIIDVRPS